MVTLACLCKGKSSAWVQGVKDSDSAQPETVLSQGQAISAPSLSAGPAATGLPAASAPTFAELKSFLSHELSSFKGRVEKAER